MGARLEQELFYYVSVVILSLGRVDQLSRMMQIVDDGSGVIDCCIPYIRVDQAKPAPVRETGGLRPKKCDAGKDTTKLSDYYPKETKTLPRRPVTPTEPPEWEPRFPVPSIGDTIRVEGKLRSKFEERIVLVDKLGVCPSNTTKCRRLMVPPTYRATVYKG